jgi:two-component system chemotaxis response regulator CheB
LSKIKVLIIDDSAFNRKTLDEILSTSPKIEVVGTAVNGEDGLKKVKALSPDVITVDLEMPVMDGFTFIRTTMAANPLPIIVVSSKKDDENVFKALELGAVEFIAKPTNIVSPKLYDIRSELVEKIVIASQSKISNVKNIIKKFQDSEITDRQEERKRSPLFSTFDFHNENKIELLAIGASTGGPTALKNLLTELPIRLNVAVVVSQHMPEGFTLSFSQRLNDFSGYIVKEARHGDYVEKGKVLIAPGGKHMTFKKFDDSVTVNLIDRQPHDNNIPSVNHMFNSAAKVFKSKTLALVLTGMGADGKEGVINIKDAGGRIIAESEDTAVVFGMPQEAIKTGNVDRVASLDEITDSIVAICNQPNNI